MVRVDNVLGARGRGRGVFERAADCYLDFCGAYIPSILFPHLRAADGEAASSN